MNKVTYTSGDGRFVVEFEPKGQTDLFEQLADFQAVFERNTVCGLCKSEDVTFQVRDIDGSKYFEKKCNKPGCFAAISYHQNKKGNTLYYSFKDKWAKYDPKAKKKDEEDD